MGAARTGGYEWGGAQRRKTERANNRHYDIVLEKKGYMVFTNLVTSRTKPVQVQDERYDMCPLLLVGVHETNAPAAVFTSAAM